MTLAALALCAFSLLIWIIAGTRIAGLAIGLFAFSLFLLLLSLVLPAGYNRIDHQIERIVSGEMLKTAVVLSGLAVAFMGFRGLLIKARQRSAARVAEVVQAQPEPPLKPVELERYSRHLMLREIGGPGQIRLKDAKVLVVGAGGLGSPVILYLAAAGVGEIYIADDDRVENSNLQRQIIHTDQRLGEHKAVSAAQSALALNPFVRVHPLVMRLTRENGAAVVGAVDLVLDGTDNFDTRYLVNRLCVEAGKPLISAAITQWEGQISLYHPKGGAPCYACVFPKSPAPGLAPACAEAGVIAPLPGVVGSLMALEAVKYLTGAGQGLAGRLMMFDGLWQESRTIRVSRRADCAICGAPHQA